MKKFSKRITMLVAILLCLVLITSSVVSTTLAKFVITKSATTSVGFTDFGITVDFDSSALGTKTPTKTGFTSSVSYDEILLKPNDLAYGEAIKFSINGEATVKTLITIDVQVVYQIDNFKIDADEFSNINTDNAYMPAGFKVNGTYAECTINSTKYTTTPFSSHASNKTAEYMERAIAAKTTGFSFSSDKLTRTLEPKAEIDMDNFSVGFDWPANYNNNAGNTNEIGTWLSMNNDDMKITSFKVIITVEQVTT